MALLVTTCKKIYNVFASTILYASFVSGFLLLFVWIYLFFHLFSRDVERDFQKITHLFYRSFLCLVRAVVPRLEIRINEDVRSIRSAVIVSNHLSFLDPILLISLYAKQKTIVKSTFFSYPFFSWVLGTCGYIPSSASGKLSPLLIKSLETMQRFLSSGGNLFIFPEGTRSRDGKLGAFNKGAFSIARKCHAPIDVLRISNTDRLFPPGKFLFNASEKIRIEVERIGSIPLESMEQDVSTSELIEKVRSFFLQREPNPENPGTLP